MLQRKLVDYLPLVSGDLREIQALLEAEEPELSLVWDASGEVFANQFVLTTTEAGVRLWERMLGITPRATETLSERQFAILIKLNAQTPFTITTLRKQLANLCGEDGYTLVLDHDAYTLTVLVALTAKNNVNAVKRMLDWMIPANLTMVLSLKYNQHQTLAPYTHGELKQFTQYNLRNEVLT